MVAGAAVDGAAHRVDAQAARERLRLHARVHAPRRVERLLCAALGDELDPLEEAAAADVADVRMIREALAQFRNRTIGFVFQSFKLLPRLTALENVELPMIYAGAAPKVRREQAKAMLSRVGLGERMGHHLGILLLTIDSDHAVQRLVDQAHRIDLPGANGLLRIVEQIAPIVHLLSK